jgi:hypothetical protein
VGNAQRGGARRANLIGLDEHPITTQIHRGTRVAFLTQHGKERLLRAALEGALGCELLHTDQYNTDLLGSFTNEISRRGSQADAARHKALIGMDLLGTTVGVGSEGSFGPDPFGGLSAWNVEMVVWLDRERQIEVTGLAQGFAMNQQRTVRSIEELEQFAREAGFPAHHLIVRPAGDSGEVIVKGICDPDTLCASFLAALQVSSGQGVVVENDLRAFCNPTRQAMISRAVDDLIRKLQSACPLCEAPGYSVTEHKPGLPCRTCGSPTRLARARLMRCSRCGHQEETTAGLPQYADPANCDVCNP